MDWAINDTKTFKVNNLKLDVTKMKSQRYPNLGTSNFIFQVKINSQQPNIGLIDVNINVFRDILEDIYASVTSNIKTRTFCQLNLKLDSLRKVWLR